MRFILSALWLGCASLQAVILNPVVGTQADLASWLAATGAVPAAAFSAGGPGTSVTLGTLTLSGATNALNVGNFSTLLSGSELAISGVENLRIDLSVPVYSIGFLFHEPTANGTGIDTCNLPATPCTDSTFAMALSDGVTVLGSFTFNATDAIAAFIGVHSDVAFTRVDLTDTTATPDNEYFGQFYTGTVPLPSITSVPEPGTIPLMAALGLGILATRRRRT